MEQVQVTIFDKRARTATENGPDQNTAGFRGVLLLLDIDAVSGTPTLDLKVQQKIGTGEYVDLNGASFAQKSTAGQDMLLIYPGVAEVANRKVNAALGKGWRVLATIGGTTPSFTFGLEAVLIP